MSDQQQRAQIVRYWWSRAEESLASAQRELDAGASSFAANRLYYAVFYAASAALFERHLSFKKHTGVRAAFHREFIRTGLLDVKWGRLYDQLFEDRQEADYVALTTFDRDYVYAQIDQTALFLDELRSLVSSLAP